MNAERLLALYERVAEAPDAITRLRRFILDLAVRGKLVPQDVNDEPASELLKRIAQEKARLLKAGEIRKLKPLAPLERADTPLVEETPGWHWVRLGSVATLITKGSTPTSYGHAYTDHGVNFIKVESIRNSHIRREDIKSFISAETNEFLSRSKLEEGDILFSIAGSIGTCAVVSATVLPANTNQALAIIRGTHVVFSNRFLLNALRSSVSNSIQILARGGAMNNVSLEDIHNFVVPVPPLAEQHRIVAKVDELMALCDRLEAARKDREAKRDRLSAASLARLNTPDPETFTADARFTLEALPALTTRPNQIKQLRQTILNLAVRGKLVPQDPSDEPASQLLKRILALPWKKKRKPSDLEPDDKALAHAFPLSAAWEWASVDALVRPNETVTYGILKPEWVAEGVPTVRVTEMKTGTIDVANLLKCDRSRAAKFQKTTLAPGDLLVSKDGTIGKTAFVPPELAGGNITQHMLRFPICDLVNSQYVRFTIDSPSCQSWMAGETKGVALQGVNVGDFRRMPIPLPPLAEQHRIVAKVDELMALCDRLEASLTTSDQTRTRLLEATLTEALAPVSQSDMEAVE